MCVFVMASLDCCYHHNQTIAQLPESFLYLISIVDISFDLLGGKHKHNGLRDIISITTNTLHITPDTDSCHATRVEPRVTPTAALPSRDRTRVTCVFYPPGPGGSFTPALAAPALRGPGCLRSNDAESPEIPASVGFETRKRAHVSSRKPPTLWTGNWK